MPVSRRRPAGWKHTLEARAQRIAAKKGEYSDTLKEMMEISKKYTKMEMDDKLAQLPDTGITHGDNEVAEDVASHPGTWEPIVLEGEIVE